mgnify:CR=1 FL=1
MYVDKIYHTTQKSLGWFEPITIRLWINPRAMDPSIDPLDPSPHRSIDRSIEIVLLILDCAKFQGKKRKQQNRGEMKKQREWREGSEGSTLISSFHLLWHGRKFSYIPETASTVHFDHDVNISQYCIVALTPLHVSEYTLNFFLYRDNGSKQWANSSISSTDSL